MADFIVTLIVTQAVLLTVCSLYCYSRDVYKEKLNRKFWIYIQEDKFNDIMQQEWTAEMKDEELDNWEQLQDFEEAQIWTSY